MFLNENIIKSTRERFKERKKEQLEQRIVSFEID